MKTTQIIKVLALGIAVVFCSCKDEYIIRDRTGLHFLPRECTQMLSLPMQYKEETKVMGPEVLREKHLQEVGTNAIEYDQLILWVMTGGDDLRSFWANYPKGRRYYEDVYDYNDLQPSEQLLAAHILELERQLRSDYQGGSGSSRSLGKSREGQVMMNVIPWPYRVTGVKDFRIVSLSPLLGKPAETSLNDYFSIYEFKPRQVISYRTKQLLWGYQDKKELKNIAQWLSLEPMAPPVVMFRLNTRPAELPIKTKLVTILETTDGKTLRDTIAVQLK